MVPMVLEVSAPETASTAQAPARRSPTELASKLRGYGQLSSATFYHHARENRT
jgi:hypothetical protein